MRGKMSMSEETSLGPCFPGRDPRMSRSRESGLSVAHHKKLDSCQLLEAEDRAALVTKAHKKRKLKSNEESRFHSSAILVLLLTQLLFLRSLIHLAAYCKMQPTKCVSDRLR